MGEVFVLFDISMIAYLYPDIILNGTSLSIERVHYKFKSARLMYSFPFCFILTRYLHCTVKPVLNGHSQKDRKLVSSPIIA